MVSCVSSNPHDLCRDGFPDLIHHRAFFFWIPVLFASLLLLLFYLFYMKCRRTNWTSMQIRAMEQGEQEFARPLDSGIKEVVREMLPVVVFQESFSVRESQCSVCLGDYKPDDRLKRIPPCGHTFHVDCIDHWLATNITCPLCRSSLVPTPRASLDPRNLEIQDAQEARTGVLVVAMEHEVLHGHEAGAMAARTATEIETAEGLFSNVEESPSAQKGVECR